MSGSGILCYLCITEALVSIMQYNRYCCPATFCDWLLNAIRYWRAGGNVSVLMTSLFWWADTILPMILSMMTWRLLLLTCLRYSMPSQFSDDDVVLRNGVAAGGWPFPALFVTWLAWRDGPNRRLACGVAISAGGVVVTAQWWYVGVSVFVSVAWYLEIWYSIQWFCHYDMRHSTMENKLWKRYRYSLYWPRKRKVITNAKHSVRNAVMMTWPVTMAVLTWLSESKCETVPGLRHSDDRDEVGCWPVFILLFGVFMKQSGGCWLYGNTGLKLTDILGGWLTTVSKAHAMKMQKTYNENDSVGRVWSDWNAVNGIYRLHCEITCRYFYYSCRYFGWLYSIAIKYSWLKCLKPIQSILWETFEAMTHPNEEKRLCIILGCNRRYSISLWLTSGVKHSI